ncbi:MAG: hypothetical protein NVSMB25_19230 [Thermoleophilaceae bacterium]
MPLAALRFYDFVVFLHVIGVVVAFGVTFTYPLIVPLTRRTDPRKLPWLHHMQATISKRVITPAATLVLVAGLFLAISHDNGFDLKDWWVSFGFISIVALLGLTGGFFAPNERRLAELAERDLGPAGEVALSSEYLRLADRVAVVGGLATALVAVTVALMVLGRNGVFGA